MPRPPITQSVAEATRDAFELMVEGKIKKELNMYEVQQCCTRLGLSSDDIELPHIRKAMQVFDRDHSNHLDLAQLTELVEAFKAGYRTAQRQRFAVEFEAHAGADPTIADEYVGTEFRLPKPVAKLHAPHWLKKCCGSPKSADLPSAMKGHLAKVPDARIVAAANTIGTAYRKHVTILESGRQHMVQEFKYVDGKYVFKCKKVGDSGAKEVYLFQKELDICIDAGVVGGGHKTKYVDQNGKTTSFGHFRSEAYDFVHAKLFDNFILLTIFVSSIVMVLQAEDDAKGEVGEHWVYVDCTFTTIFTVEMGMKWIAFGFVGKKPDGYFKSAWNWLDFVIVLEGLMLVVTLIAGGDSGSSSLKSVRVIRTLRPLRAVNRLPELKVIVNSMIQAVPILRDALSVCTFLLVLFAIAGVQWFGGAFHSRCIDPNIPAGHVHHVLDHIDFGIYVSNNELCGEGARECPLYTRPGNISWDVYDLDVYNFTSANETQPDWVVKVQSDCMNDIEDNPNSGMTGFDNLGIALLTIFQAITLEGWVEMMEYAMDSSTDWAWAYFVALIFVGSFVLLNLLMAVIVMKFSEEKQIADEEKKSTFEERLDKAKKAWNNAYSDVDILHRLPDVHNYVEDIEELEVEVPEKNRDKYKKMSCTVGWARNIVRPHLENSAGKVVPNRKPTMTADEPAGLVKSKHCRRVGVLTVDAVDVEQRLSAHTDQETEVTTVTFLTPMRVTISSQADISGWMFVVKGVSVTGKDIEQEFTGVNNNTVRSADLFRRVDAVEVVATTDAVDAVGAVDAVELTVGYEGYEFEPAEGGGSFPYFENFMSIMVSINILLLAIDHHTTSPEAAERLGDVLYWNNFVFTIIFAVEMSLKVLGFGPITYFLNFLNLVDSAVVAIGFIEIFSDESSGLTAFRAVRFMRLVKLAKSMQSMKEIFSVLKNAWRSVVYVMLLLMLFVFIFTVAGMQFFAGKLVNPDLTVPRNNYDSFYWGFISTFQVLAGEDWPAQLYAAKRATGWGVSVTFYVAWVVIGQLIVLNLFLAVIMGYFEAEEKESEKTDRFSTNDDEVRDKFRLYDINDDKFLDKQEITVALKEQFGFNVDPVFLTELFEQFDEDQNGEIDEEEFLNMYSSLTDRTPPPKLDPPDAQQLVCCIKHGGPYQLFCFRVLNTIVPIRIPCVGKWETPPPIFELVIFIIIIFSSATLALYSPNNSNGMHEALFVVDIVTTIIFGIEIIIKVSALGLLCHRNSYLRDPYNVIDFIVVVIGTVSILIVGKERGGPQVSVARLFRALRPLRMISQCRGLQLIVSATVNSLAAIANVVIVVVFAWLLFALLGVSFFKGKLYHCNDPAFPPGGYRYGSSLCDTLVDGKNCIPEIYEGCLSNVTFINEDNNVQARQWVNADMNFDHVGYAFISLFVFSTGEGWPGAMFAACDIVDVDFHPKTNSSPTSAVFFVVYVAVSGFFIMELFTGAIFEHFISLKREADQSRKTFLVTDEQRKWVTATKLIAKTQPLQPQRPRDIQSPCWRRIVHTCFRLCTHSVFSGSVIVAVSLNTVVMAATYHSSPEWFSELQHTLNEIFVWIFVAEMFIRITGLGLRAYFRDNWNFFDCVVVIGSLFDTYLAAEFNLALFRIFRVFRVFRLLQIFPGFKLVFDSLTTVLPVMANVGTLVFLLFFIAAVMGVSLLGEVPVGGAIDQHNNFESFGAAMLTLFRVSTGEDWQLLAFQAANGPNGYTVAILYFVIFQWVAAMVILNIFVMVIAAGMEENNDNDKKSLAKDLTAILTREFQHSWAHFDPEATMWLESEKLPELLKFMENKSAVLAQQQRAALEPPEAECGKRLCGCLGPKDVEARRGLDPGTLERKCGLVLHGKGSMTLPQIIRKLRCAGGLGGMEDGEPDKAPSHVHFNSVLVGLFTCVSDTTLQSDQFLLATGRIQSRLRAKNGERTKNEIKWNPNARVRDQLTTVMDRQREAEVVQEAEEGQASPAKQP